MRSRNGQSILQRSLLPGVLLATFAIVPVVSGQPSSGATGETATNGAGIWKSRSQTLARATQEWALAVTRGADDSLHGRISIADSPTLHGGNVHGRVSGKSVSGTITDDDGNFVAAFEGVLDGEEMAGTYRSADGDSGTWSWSEPAAKQVVAERTTSQAQDESALDTSESGAVSDGAATSP